MPDYTILYEKEILPILADIEERWFLSDRRGVYDEDCSALLEIVYEFLRRIHNKDSILADAASRIIRLKKEKRVLQDALDTWEAAQ